MVAVVRCSTMAWPCMPCSKAMAVSSFLLQGGGMYIKSCLESVKEIKL